MEKNIYYPLDYGWYDSKDKCSESLLQEGSVDYGEAQVNSGDEHKRTSLFWRFPARQGIIQPWRRKLWELKK
ncbi:hypothetical protein [Paenibacillus sp.]|uniref:hypothetical protein n=1 Tax=Paenibacillus sp. TaxID=58172 RepID=UPI0028ABBFB3|nr:hypothetical protein [Paenibacillus sp.]